MKQTQSINFHYANVELKISDCKESPINAINKSAVQCVSLSAKVNTDSYIQFSIKARRAKSFL